MTSYDTTFCEGKKCKRREHCNVEVWQHISNIDYELTEPIVKSAIALLKIY